LVFVGLELGDFLVVCTVVELLEAVMTEEARALRHQLIITCQPQGFFLTNTAGMTSDLGIEEHKPRVHLHVAAIRPGVEQSGK